MAKVLVVEDDLDLLAKVKEWLGFEQHSVEAVTDGQEASERLRLYQYDLVILDWELPGLTGVDVLRLYRDTGGTTPVLMLTGKGAVDDKMVGLDAGADDYLTKPFHLKELSARMRALLRRPPSFTGNILHARNITLDPCARKVTKSGQDIQLLPREFALLEFFMRHPNEIFSPEALLNRVWSSESDSTVGTVYTYIKTLRKKIAEPDGNSVIATVHGVGYKLVPS